ncbi:LD-carboxypeptidase [Nibrella viscosa]|uniref:LD-carboxypeptidase n=1 Tax=Nibrella viscosa TaxID=1084524 RepID=A0ABP8JVN8_9BACT
MSTRRSFLKFAGLFPVAGFSAPVPPATLKPRRLNPGDTIGLFCPAAPAYSREQVTIAVESLQALGFKTKMGPHFYDRYGYLAGRDADRAADLNAFFADPTVNGVIAMHGGWGCARLLPLLDYGLIRRNPKPLLGYSDITALLLGIHAKTGLITFHGPEGAATWNAYTVDWFRRVLMNAEAVTLQNPADKGDNLVQVQDRISTLTPGTARGRLLGGNLTVLSHLIGSPYLPDWQNSILFVEDVGEDVYRMDRMLTHLKLAGILDQLSGFVFGKCTRCDAGSGSYGSLTLEDVFADHIAPLRKPAFTGAMIGHIKDKFTVPVGIAAEMDAGRGTIRLLEGAVQ